MSPTPESPNVLLVVLDSVRAANTTHHGHANDTMPFLEELADKATVYTQARAPGTESVSSHTSIFTGLHVRQHRVTNRRRRLAPNHTVWEDLSERGYDTAVFSNNPFLTELPVGLTQSFDHVVGRRQEQPYPDAVNPKNFVIDAADRGSNKYLDFLRTAFNNGQVLGSLANGLSFKMKDSHPGMLPDRLEPDSSADLYASRFEEWHERLDGPWAACINFMDAHYPYTPGSDHDHWGSEQIHAIQRVIGDQAWEFIAGDRPWGERRAVQSLYDGAIRRMDAAVRRLVDTLRRDGELDETLVVVTADHGEGFGERSRVRAQARIVGHGNGGLHECVLHVPLVVKYPGQNSSDRSDQVTSLSEFPTAVKQTIAGNGGVDAFLPEDPVVCSTEGVDPDTAERAREYCDSIEPYDVAADAVYTDNGDAVRKEIQWGDVSRTIQIRDAHTSWVVPSATSDVDSVIAQLPEANVRASAKREVSEETISRLEDLGYA
jgi:arylsulfatase